MTSVREIVPKTKRLIEQVYALRTQATDKSHPQYNQAQVDYLYTVMKQTKQVIVDKLKNVTSLSEKYELEAVLKELGDALAIFEGNVSNELLSGGKMRRRTNRKRTNRRRTNRKRTNRRRTRHKRR